MSFIVRLASDGALNNWGGLTRLRVVIAHKQRFERISAMRRWVQENCKGSVGVTHIVGVFEGPSWACEERDHIAHEWGFEQEEDAFAFQRWLR